MIRILIALTLSLATQLAPAADSTDVYYLAFLRPDPARAKLKEGEGDRIQAAHMANIRKMAADGVLVAAGPFDDQPTTISGIFVFRTPSLEAARAIAAQDPTVLEHRNLLEVHAWRGPKGIGEEYARLHKAKPETPEGMGVQPLFLLYRGTASADQKREMNSHEDYLTRLKREGKLAMAGPTEGKDDLLSVVVFNRISDAEAQKLMAEDPAVKTNALRYEFHRWWCAEHVIPVHP
jgi:uncharacterized protein YciI